MTKIRSSPKRNVESIRQKNIEDNQRFLEKLLMANIRNDFVNSARSILRKDGSDQIKKHFPRQYQKIERTTRYNEKVKSGEIPPHVPEWQRDIERKILEKEQEQQQKEMKRQAREIELQAKKIERQEKQREKEMKREAMEIERQEKRRQKERVKKIKRREKRRQKQRVMEMRREEKLFEDELKKIEGILKFEEALKIKRAQRHRHSGPSKCELLYYDKSNPERRSYDLRHSELTKD